MTHASTQPRIFLVEPTKSDNVQPRDIYLKVVSGSYHILNYVDGGWVDTTPYTIAPTLSSVLATIAAGVIAPAAPDGLLGFVRVAGEGGLDDDLDTITAPASWLGKFIVLKASGSGSITVKASSSINMAADFTLDSATDKLVLFCTGTNTFDEISRSSNG